MKIRTFSILTLLVFALFLAWEVWKDNRDRLAGQTLVVLGLELPLGGVLGGLMIAVAGVALAVLAVNTVGNYLRELGRGHERRFRENLEVRYLHGLEALLGGRAAEALRALGEVLDDEPGHPGALLRAGEASRKLGRVEEAIAHHRRLVEARPADSAAALALADDYLAAGRRDEARRLLVEHAQRRPDPATLRALRRIQIEDEDWAGALDSHGRVTAQKQAPATQEEAGLSLMLPYELARAEAGKGKAKDATARLQRLAKEHPEFAPAHVLLGEVAVKHETDLGGAIERWQAGFMATQQPVFLQKIEDAMIRSGDPEGALSLFRTAAAELPDNVLIRFFLAKLLFRLELRTEAEREFGRLAALHPDSATVSYFLGRLAERRGDLRNCAEHYRAVIRGARALDIHYLCAKCGERRADWADRCGRCRAFNSFAVEWRDPEAQDKLSAERPDYVAGLTP